MQEAGYTPGVSAYDSYIEQAEAAIKSQGVDLPKETLVDLIKDKGMNPDKRAGFGAYAGLDPMSLDPKVMQGIAQSPLVAAMEEGYDSTLGSHAAQVSRANAVKHVPLIDEYDTGSTSAKVATGKPLMEAPPAPTPVAAKTVTPGATTGSTLRVGTSTSTGTIPTVPTPHGTIAAPVAAHAAPVVPITPPNAPSARILTATRADNVTVREAIRGIAEDIKAVRKPGQRLLSADGSKAMAEAVTQGIKGSRNLKMLAVGSALGLGGYAANRLANRGDTSDLRG